MPLDQDKIRKLFQKLTKSLKPDANWKSPEKVHTLRKRTRRLEAVLRSMQLNQDHPGSDLLKHLKRARKKAGAVRDMDVLTSIAAGLASESSDESFLELVEHLGQQRQKSAQKLRSLIAKHGSSARHALKRCSSLLEKYDPSDWQQHHGNSTAAATDLVAELAATPKLTAANLHRFRIKSKELRYTLELAVGKENAFVQALSQLSDAIGQWHDWSELLAIAQALHKGSAASREIRATVATQLKHALKASNAMRDKYLHGTVRLAA